jgi:predicted secreted Zn-dependent protease
MKLKGFLLALFLTAAIPAAALARGPTAAEHSNAAAVCAGLEKAIGSATFTATYGTNATRSDAFGACTASWAKLEQQDTLKATRQCALEQNDSNFAASHGGKSFAQFYGTGKSGEGAFGRCVSKMVRATTTQQAEATLNAAQACAKERAADAVAFKAKYGTNANKSNAFGRCVSLKSTIK